MVSQIKVIVTDDKKLFREAIRDALQEFHINVIAEAENGRELLNLLQNMKPDVILLDIEMQVMDGNETLDHVMKQYPYINVIILSYHDDQHLMENYISRGAKAYFVKDRAVGKVEKLVEAIEQVSKGRTYINFERQNIQLTFSPIQKDIISYYGEGLKQKDIAKELGITTDAVEKQKKKIMKMLGIENSHNFLIDIVARGLRFLGPKLNRKQ